MGQQQLLLIVLGVIIVGIAVVVGINVFTASAAQANRDAVIADMTNLAAMAQQYYRKPGALGGGGNVFTDWSIPTQLRSNANGSYTVDGGFIATGVQSIVIVGTGLEVVDGNHVSARMVVGPNAIDTTVILF